MNSRYKEWLKGKTVSGYVFGESSLTISLHGEEEKIELFACADCCSESWFEELEGQPFDDIIGKEIVDIINTYEDVELEESGRQECDQNKKIVINFADDTILEFVLRNSSNGYYSGWLEIR
jgi:hypothetical protein